MLGCSSAAQLRETIVKRVAQEFKNGMYSILLFYMNTFLKIILLSRLEENIKHY